MSTSHRDSNRWRIVTVAVTVVVLSAVGWFFLRSSDEPTGAAGAEVGVSSDRDAQERRALRQANREARDLARPAKVNGKPGLGGEGFSTTIGGSTLRITVTSAGPIGTIGYVIPISQDKPSGVVNGVGNSWSLSTTVYGPGDYAQVFFQSGPSGTPISCVITVDGKVTERRSTSGPYSQTMCQG